MKINLYKKGSGFMKKWIVSMCFFLLLSGCIKNNEKDIDEWIWYNILEFAIRKVTSNKNKV